MKKEVLEGEIVSEGARIKKKQNQPNDIDMQPMTFPRWRLLLCLVPVIGLLFSMSWYYYAKAKQQILLFPIIGVSIAIFATTTFIILRFILRAIF